MSNRIPTPRLLRPLGGLLLLSATGLWFFASTIAAGHVGDEPPLVYLVALVAFCFTSAGAALLLNGKRLLETVPVAGRWTILSKPAPGVVDPDGDHRAEL